MVKEEITEMSAGNRGVEGDVGIIEGERENRYLEGSNGMDGEMESEVGIVGTELWGAILTIVAI